MRSHLGFVFPLGVHKHFMILAVSLFKSIHTHTIQTHTHTPSGEDQRANMQEIGLRFYFVSVSDSGQLFVLCFTFFSQRWTEGMEGKDKNERTVQCTLFPQWMETHTHTYTGL